MAVEHSCRTDPLATFLLKVSGQRTWAVALMAVGIYAVLVLGGGLAVSLRYERAGVQFLTILERRESLLASYLCLLVAPAIWSIYASQPKWILQALMDVGRNGVIVADRQSDGFNGFMQGVVHVRLGKWAYSVAGVVIGLVGIVVFLAYALRPGNPYFYGFRSIWWLVNPAYLGAVWSPLVIVINAYMLVWIVVRQAVAVKSFTDVFEEFKVSPKLFHHDGSNGFAAIGQYALGSGLFAVFFGFWIFVMTVFPALYGERINADYITVLLSFFYIVAIPFLLIPPVLGAHAQMGKAKDRALEDVAIQIRVLLSEPYDQTLPVSMAMVELLERKYQLLAREYRTWPFNTQVIRRFSIAAAMPLVATAASVLIGAYVG